jgi:glyoxylase I family protein
MRLLGTDHIILRIRDPAAMEPFHIEVLGREVERRREAIGRVRSRA